MSQAETPGSRTDAELAAIATDLIARRASRMTRGPITDDIPLDMADAYRIQHMVTASRAARGERQVGWKLGYTSQAMRTQMGVAEPNYGPLTDAMVIPSGGTAAATLMQPRVEPEIALMFSRDVSDASSISDVLDAVDHAFACLEVVDSVFEGYRFRIEDNTADGSSAAMIVVGPQLAGCDALDQISVDMFRNGTHHASAIGAAASGHPALGVIWLVDQLAQSGRKIQAGEFVITGGLCSAVPLDIGDVVSAMFDGAIEVIVRR